MKYRLRILMIVVALICVGVGCRVEYLRRWAAYHNREGVKLLAENYDSAVASKAIQHFQLVKQYRAAMFRPWTIVDETFNPLEFADPRPNPSAPAPTQPKP